MRNLLLTLLAIFSLQLQKVASQKFQVVPKPGNITVKRIEGSNLMIPIEMDVIRPLYPDTVAYLKMFLKNSTTDLGKFEDGDILSGKVAIINPKQMFPFASNNFKLSTSFAYLFVDNTVDVETEKQIYIEVYDTTNVISIIKVTIQPEDRTLSLDEYDNNKLVYIHKGEINGNILTLTGFRRGKVKGKEQDILAKKNVELNNGKFKVTEWGHIFSPYYWRQFPITLVTVPFKVRSKITEDGKQQFSTTATSGLSNFGINLELGKIQFDRYKVGKKVTHRFSLGVLATPTVEELDSIYTGGGNKLLGKNPGKVEKSRQLFISTGITISYSYNDISFIYVPFGWDLATTSLGKTWVYNKKKWWGFGIAISPRIFAPLFK